MRSLTRIRLGMNSNGKSWYFEDRPRGDHEIPMYEYKLFLFPAIGSVSEGMGESGVTHNFHFIALCLILILKFNFNNTIFK